MQSQLSLPPTFDPRWAMDETFNVTNAHMGPTAIMAAAENWAKEHQIRSAMADRKKVVVLGIDWQYDFGFAGGSLFVSGRSGKGAMEDAGRVSEFILRNLRVISRLVFTLDTHKPYQIFYPSAHVMRDGSHPGAFGNITVDMYRSGDVSANPTMAAALHLDPVTLTRQFLHYCSELSKQGRYDLTLWPEHCMLGSHGHQLAGVIDWVRYFHGYARGVDNGLEIKGGNPLTENYSIFKPEVTTMFNGKPIPGAQKNAALIKLLVEDADMVIICGQAMSHCVNWSVKDLVDEIVDEFKQPELLKKIYLLRDGMSAVVVPGVVDHTDAALAKLAEFQNRGVNVVDSTTPIESWLGVAQEIAAVAV